MTVQRDFSRRAILHSGVAFAAVASNSAQESAYAGTVPQGGTKGAFLIATELGVVPGLGKDQSVAVQAAIDRAAERGAVLMLPAGPVVVSNIVLRARTQIAGVGASSVIVYGGGGTLFRGAGADGVMLRDFSIDGGGLALDRSRSRALIDLTDTRGLSVEAVSVSRSGADGIALARCAGRIERVVVEGAADAGIFSLDADSGAGAIEISDTHVRDCRDNGILIWRSSKGADGSRVTNTTILRIGNKSGGTGQYGNGVNVFRAGGVSVSGCRMVSCAYSAVRGNAADDIRMLGNHASDIGEVALYAEFGFAGAVIANNVVNGAATGIAVTNFDHGGRLAVVQGNLVRNLRRREHEPVDKRGEGIAVEADAAVTGNVIEGAATAGMLIGWGKHMRDVAATGNVVRDCSIGIGVSVSDGAGACVVASNVVSGATRGGIVGMDHHAIVSADPGSDSRFRTIRFADNVVV